MRILSALLMCLLLAGIASAQEEQGLSYPEETLERIRVARETNATELVIDELNDSGIPPELWTLTQLRSLKLAADIDYSYIISELPPEIGNLINLENLSLSGNSGLRTLPAEIGNLRNLTYLDLSMTGIQDLPVEILNLTNLERLDFHYHGPVPEIVFQLTSLKRLEIGANGLTSLSPAIGNLVNLQQLGLANNELQSLPSEIGQLRNLEVLHLGSGQIGRNQLVTLPAEIGQLHQLRVLDISSNRLESLPPEIGQLSNLCYLNLSNNQLRYLPSSMFQLTTLIDNDNCGVITVGLFIGGNPLISPPQEVIAQGTPAILQYLRNEAWYYLQKLIVSGLGSLGLVTLLVLGLRWKNARGKQKRKVKEL